MINGHQLSILGGQFFESPPTTEYTFFWAADEGCVPQQHSEYLNIA